MCKDIIYDLDLFSFTTLFVNDEYKPFFCVLHSQNPKGLLKTYIYTSHTHLPLHETRELSSLSSWRGKLSFSLMIFNSYKALAILIFKFNLFLY